MPVGAVCLIRLEGTEKGPDLVCVIGAERIEDQVNVDLFLFHINDIVCPQLDVGEERLGRVGIAILVFLARGKVAVRRKVVRNAKRLHVRLVQPSAIVIPHDSTAERLELIVLFGARRVEVQIPLPPL